MYDVAIIGMGVAGLSAAMYSGRFNMKVVVFGELPGGLITTTNEVENYPGIKSITGQELSEVMQEHAKVYGAEFNYERVEDIEKKDGYFLIKNSKEYKAKTVILAMGTEVRKLGVPGEERLSNRGVSYCALCDGAFYKDKVVAVVGGGDSAVVDALILTKHARKVYVIVRKDSMKAEPSNQKKLMENDKVQMIYNTNVIEMLGDKKLEKVRLDNPFEGSDLLDLDGCFIAIGHIINSDLAKKLGVNLNKKGEIIIDREARTNVEGVYAAGDVADLHFKQAITAAAEGVIASHSAYEYVHR